MLVTTEKIDYLNKFGNFYFNLGKKEIILKEGEHLLIFKGYLYPDIPYNVKDLLDFFKEFKLNLDFKKFKGRFCGVYINKNKNCLFIFNDQLGLNDIFYLFKKEKLTISDKFANFFKIANFKKGDLDNIALGEFLLYEHVFLDRTFIKNIKLLRYASLKKFDLLRKKTKDYIYWDYKFNTNKKFNRNSAIKKIDRLFCASIKRIHLLNPRKEFLIGLSGGLDSRLVAKYAIQEGMKIYPFVFSNKGADAFYISEKIAENLGLKLKKIIIKNDYWKWKKKHIKYDPMMNIMYTAYYSISGHLDKKKIMLTGFNGDNLFGSHIKKDDFKKSFTLLKKINKKYKLIQEEIISEQIIEKINNEIKTYAEKAQSDWQRKEIFNFESRQLRFIKNAPCFGFYGKFENHYSPFTDIDLVEYLLTFPADELYQCKIYYDFIKKYHPELSKIRLERTPYSIYDSKYLNYLKKFLYLSKILIEKYTNIKIPLFRTITFKGALDWEYLFKKINFKKEIKDIAIKGLNRQKIITLGNSLNSIRIKYHYLTIQNFIKSYLK